MKLRNIEIRKANISDINSIAQIKVTGFQNAYNEIIDNRYLASMSVSEQIKYLNEYYNLDDIFVALINDELSGFCRVYDCKESTCKDEKNDCEIREIYVNPSMKRMGIGSKLFNYISEYFKQKGKKRLYLSCLKDNYNSRKFYEKMGGIQSGENTIKIGEKSYNTVSYIFNLTINKSRSE